MIPEQDLEIFRQFLLSLPGEAPIDYSNLEFLYCCVFKEDLTAYYETKGTVPLRISNLIQYLIEVVMLNDIETAADLQEFYLKSDGTLSRKIHRIMTESHQEVFHRHVTIEGEHPENN